MSIKRFVYWQDEDKWIGYWEESPDYWTQGDSFEDLKEHLIDLHGDLHNGEIPCVRRIGEMEIS